MVQKKGGFEREEEGWHRKDGKFMFVAGAEKGKNCVGVLGGKGVRRKTHKQLPSSQLT